MIPQPDYEIQEEDIAIFIGPTSFPAVSADPRDRPSYHRRCLEELARFANIYVLVLFLFLISKCIIYF